MRLFFGVIHNAKVSTAVVWFGRRWVESSYRRVVWSPRRIRRSQVARARLAALTPGWVPTNELVQEALSRFEVATGASPTQSVTAADPVVPTQDGPSTQTAADVATPDHLDVAPVRLRLDHPAARGLMLLAVGAVFGGVIVAFLAWPRGGSVEPAAAPPVIEGASGQAEGVDVASPTPSASVVVVDVAGFVRRPGVVELAVGSRVIDALKETGGVRARGDTSSLNLAQVLVDGEQVLVPSVHQLPVPPASSSTSPGAVAGELVDINTATLEQLDTLPGIGPVLAQAIIDWRTQNGSFTSIEQLREVSGIGDATFADLQPLVRV